MVFVKTFNEFDIEMLSFFRRDEVVVKIRLDNFLFWFLVETFELDVKFDVFSNDNV